MEHFHESAQNQRHQVELKHAQATREQEQRYHALKIEKEKEGFEVERLKSELNHRDKMVEQTNIAMNETKATCLQHEKTIGGLRTDLSTSQAHIISLKDNVLKAREQGLIDTSVIHELRKTVETLQRQIPEDESV